MLKNTLPPYRYTQWGYKKNVYQGSTVVRSKVRWHLTHLTAEGGKWLKPSNVNGFTHLTKNEF